MKSIVTYINESVSKVDVDEFEQYALSAIDYMYNEGIADYSDKNLAAYINGDKTPNYKGCIDSILYEFEDKLSKQLVKELKKYPNTDLKDDIEISIIRAMEQI